MSFVVVFFGAIVVLLVVTQIAGRRDARIKAERARREETERQSTSR